MARFAAAGFLVLMLWAGYQHLTLNNLPRTPAAVDWILVVLCPWSMVSAFLVDLNVGSLEFYSLYFVVGLANTFLYGNIAAAIIGLRELFGAESYTSGRLGTGSRVASEKWPEAKLL